MLFFCVFWQNAFPMLSSQHLVQRLYPYNSILGKDGRTAVEGVLSVSQDMNHHNVPNCCLHVVVTLLWSQHKIRHIIQMHSFWPTRTLLHYFIEI